MSGSEEEKRPMPLSEDTSTCSGKVEIARVASQLKAMMLLTGFIGIAVSITLAARIEIASKAVTYAVMCTLLILATLLWMLAAARGKGIIWDTPRDPMGLEPLQLALLATSTILATGLNCTSYYFCCLCVWFIAELSKLDSLRALPGFQHLPRLSSVVQKLERTNTNSFLLVSLMLSIVILAESPEPPRSTQQ